MRYMVGPAARPARPLGGPTPVSPITPEVAKPAKAAETNSGTPPAAPPAKGSVEAAAEPTTSPSAVASEAGSPTAALMDVVVRESAPKVRKSSRRANVPGRLRALNGEDPKLGHATRGKRRKMMEEGSEG